MDDDGAIVIEDVGGSGGEGGEGGGGSEEELDLGGGGEGGEEHHEEETDDELGGQGDEHRGPVDIRKALRSLATNEEIAKSLPKNFEKQVTGALFTRQQVDQLGGLRAISDTLEKLETHGGIEGVEQMAEEFAASKELERGLERGDPKVIEGWAKDYPDGFKRSIVPSLDQLEKMDEEKFEHVSSYVLTKIFEKFGMFTAANELGTALSAGADKLPDAIKKFNAIAKFLSDTRNLSGKAKTDPHAGRSEELDRRKAELDNEATKNFKSVVREDVNREVGSELNRQLRAYLKANKIFKVSANTANRLRKEINSELQRLVNGDPNHARQYDSVMASRDRKRAANYVIKAAIRNLPKAIKAVAPDFNLKRSTNIPGGGGPRRSAGGGSREGGDGVKVKSGVPKSADVDFSRTPMDRFLASRSTHGEAWLKDGTKAKW